MATKGRRAAVYARLSQDRGMEKVSVPRQIEECKALAERLGWEVVETLQDRDVSASNRNAKRPGYDGLLKTLESGQVNAVLARETSRLYRRPRQLEDLIDLIEGKGIEIATVFEGDVDLSTANGRMMARIRVSVDKQESERLSERVRSAKAQNKADGVWLGGGRRPYGYDIADEEGKPRRFTINRAEAKVIRDLARRIVDGESLYRLTIGLNDKGIPTVGGGRWKSAHVKRLLLRDLPPSIPAVLDPDTARIVRARLEAMPERGRGRSGGFPKSFVLTGLVTCGRTGCGRGMHGSGEYYRCYPEAGGCGMSISALRLEQYLVQRMKVDIRKFIAAHKEPEPAEPVEVDQTVLAEMAEIEDRLKTLAGDLGLSERQLAARSQALEERYRELQSSLSSVGAPARKETPEETLALTARLYQKWFNRELAETEILALHDAIGALVATILVRPRDRGNEDLDDRVEIRYVREA